MGSVPRWVRREFGPAVVVRVAGQEGAGEMLGATGVALAVGIGLAGLAMIVLLDVALAAVL